MPDLIAGAAPLRPSALETASLPASRTMTGILDRLENAAAGVVADRDRPIAAASASVRLRAGNAELARSTRG